MKDIGKILRKVTGDDDSPVEKEKEEEKKQKWIKSLSYYGQAFVMFREKKSLVDASIEIDQEANIILNYYTDYLRLVRMDGLASIYKDLKDTWPVFIHLYRTVKKEGLNKQDIIKLLDNQNKLVEFDKCVDIYNDSIQNL